MASCYIMWGKHHPIAFLTLLPAILAFTRAQNGRELMMSYSNNIPSPMASPHRAEDGEAARGIRCWELIAFIQSVVVIAKLRGKKGVRLVFQLEH